MATLAEQRIDDKLRGKDSDSSLNTSKADGHISSQESLAETSRRQILATKISENNSKSDLNQESPAVSRRDSNQADITNTENATIRGRPFVLSSRAAFDERNIFAAARKVISTNGSNSPIQENSTRDVEKNGVNPDYDTPTHSKRLRVGTPLGKQAQYIFKRTFDATFKPSDVCGTDIVLASDSGEEDS